MPEVDNLDCALLARQIILHEIFSLQKILMLEYYDENILNISTLTESDPMSGLSDVQLSGSHLEKSMIAANYFEPGGKFGVTEVTEGLN